MKLRRQWIGFTPRSVVEAEQTLLEQMNSLTHTFKTEHRLLQKEIDGSKERITKLMQAKEQLLQEQSHLKYTDRST